MPRLRHAPQDASQHRESVEEGPLTLTLSSTEVADLRVMLLAELTSLEGEDDFCAKALIARCASLLGRLDGLDPLYADFG
jgi:hypothetical protein